MRTALAIAIAIAIAIPGCALPEPEPALPTLRNVEIHTLALSTECATRGELFLVMVGVRNLEPQAGETLVEAYALQEGRIGVRTVELGPYEGTQVDFTVTIPQAGSWPIYVSGPHVTAPQVVLKVIDPAAGGRC